MSILPNLFLFLQAFCMVESLSLTVIWHLHTKNCSFSVVVVVVAAAVYFVSAMVVVLFPLSLPCLCFAIEICLPTLISLLFPEKSSKKIEWSRNRIDEEDKKASPFLSFHVSGALVVLFAWGCVCFSSAKWWFLSVDALQAHTKNLYIEDAVRSMYRITRFASFLVLAVYVSIHSSVFLFLFLFRCYAFDFVGVVVAGVVVFLLEFCLHPFSSHACDAFLLAYKKPYGFDLPPSIFFSCFNLRYQHYIFFPFCQHYSWCALHLVYAIFLLLYLEFGALHSSSMPRYEAIHSFSGSFFFFFPQSKSFFQASYHSIANVMYTWVVSSRCWMLVHIFLFASVCLLCTLNVNVLQTSCSLENGFRLKTITKTRYERRFTTKKSFKKINISGKKTSTAKKMFEHT